MNERAPAARCQGGTKEPCEHLRVRVNDELVLDTGTREEVLGPHGPEWLLRPPATPPFRQLLAYLAAKPDPPKRPAGSMVGREGVAATALCLRWGTYLAVLMDRDKPVWSAVDTPGTSRVSDAEMARIDIEASAALAEWIDLFREDGGGPEYARLVDRAVCYLPMPRKSSTLTMTALAAPADPAVATQLIERAAGPRLERARDEAEQCPSRLFANAIVNAAWRNGPIEDIHAGEARGYPLDERRVAVAEERALMRYTSGRMALGMALCLHFAMERPRRPWAEQVLPFGLAEVALVTPSGWTLTETSREVRLPAGDEGRGRTKGGDGPEIQKPGGVSPRLHETSSSRVRQATRRMMDVHEETLRKLAE